VKDSKGKSTVASRETANQKVGLRTGNGKVSSVNASYGANTGRVRIKQTELTSLIGNKVNVNVGNNTHLKGSLLAAGKYDKTNTFIDNENLNLKTKTLTYANNTDTKYSTSNSFKIGTNIGLNQNAKDDTTKVNSTNLAFSNKLGYQRDKTLATLGKGKVTITDKENSDDLNSLNRDTKNIKKSQAKIGYGVEVDASLDHRLLSEEGRKEIKEDFQKSGDFVSAIGDIVTTDAVEAKDFFEHAGNVNTQYEFDKKLASKDNGKYVKILNNLDTSTEEQKSEAVNAYAQTYAGEYGISIQEAKVIALNKVYKGATYSLNKTTNTIMVNDKGNKNAIEYSNTLTHELNHAQVNQGTIRDRGEEGNEEYSKLMGEYGEEGFQRAYSNAEYGDVKTGNVNAIIGNDSSKVIATNNADFINKAVNEADKIDYSRLAQDEVNFIYDNIDKIKEKLSNKYGHHTLYGKNLQLNAEQVALQAAKYMVDGDFAKSKTGSSIVTNEATLKEVGAILLKMSDGKYIRNNYVDGTTEKMFTATKKDYNNPNADPDNEKGLGDQGVVIVPTTRVVQVIGSGVKSVSPVVIQGGKNAIKKVDKIDNAIGSYISIKKDNLPLPSKVKKWTTDKVSYEDINDFYNPSLPPTTAIGGASAIIYDKGKELIKNILEEDKLNHENKD